MAVKGVINCYIQLMFHLLSSQAGSQAAMAAADEDVSVIRHVLLFLFQGL
ncbi:MAG: hypothetical protein ACLFNW_06625 [Desulfobacterales bacterium]